MRYFLDIAYRGTAFHGWQIQPNAVTVQEEINRALSVLLQSPTECVGSGRTDAGVHATHQVAHIDTGTKLDSGQLRYKLNALLPYEISVNEIRPVIPEAHARFDAVHRTYHYYIHTAKDPFKAGISYLFTPQLNTDLICKANELIRVWTDFQAFSKVQTDVNHFDCKIFEISWTETNDGHVFCVSANRFLRGMVRAMVGTLLDVGQRKRSLYELEEILKSGIRSNAGRSAPPEGLFLTEVGYPDSIYLDT
ncbi:MAG: tRNA pseudouridine(38-40) synthase TruA [Marinoscillum sp.]